jgi:UDP-N-acetylglucosamine 2-epimerase (non-hydrolysing)
VVVNWDTEAKNMASMRSWFFKMMASILRSKKILGGYTGKSSIVLTHGDTFTTWFAALYGRLTLTKVMHVESGLRSYNLFKPFPEEINRIITFILSNYFAAPGDWAINNLRHFPGKKINTHMNTQVDTIRFGLDNCDSAKIKIPKQKYAVVSVHRYENIFKQERFKQIIDEIGRISKKMHLVFVQHPATEEQLEKTGLIKKLQRNKNINIVGRLEYLMFIKLIKNSEFVITDGGGNQEELFHMGKPTLIFRNETERQEGLGETAVISKLDPTIIDDFISNYKNYARKPTSDKLSPSKIIVDVLKENNFG